MLYGDQALSCSPQTFAGGVVIRFTGEKLRSGKSEIICPAHNSQALACVQFEPRDCLTTELVFTFNSSLLVSILFQWELVFQKVRREKMISKPSDPPEDLEKCQRHFLPGYKRMLMPYQLPPPLRALLNQCIGVIRAWTTLDNKTSSLILC